MSSSSVVSLSSFNLLFFTQVLTVLTSSIKYNEYVTDKGKNISIPCSADGSIMWVKENENSNSSTIIQTGKFLVLTNVSANDRGLYVCFASVTPVTRLVTPTAASKAPTSPSPNPTSTSADAEATPISPSSSNVTSSVVAVTATETSKVVTAAEPSMAAATPATASTTSPPPTETESTVAATLPPPSIRVFIKNATGGETNDSSPFAVDIVADDIEEYVAVDKFNLTVRTPPGPVTQLYFKASTILGFLIWRVNKTNNGGYPLRSFTAEYRNVSRPGEPYVEHAWSRMDPANIAPNVRQMEVYHLEPNSTYEFRIWANNVLGSGDIVTTNVTTLPETKEEDLIRLIQPDLDNFDPRIWIVAVSVVLGTLVILAIGLCIVLSKECYQSSHMAVEDGWDSIELIPNIILNPGFCEADGTQPQPYTRTIIFGEDDASDSYESESDHEPRMEKYKRKVSMFFQGPMVHRI